MDGIEVVTLAASVASHDDIVLGTELLDLLLGAEGSKARNQDVLDVHARSQLRSQGDVISTLEEWTNHKKTQTCSLTASAPGSRVKL